MTLVIGQSCATEGLGIRYNYFQDGVLGDLISFVSHGPKSLRMLDLGITAISLPVLWSVAEQISDSDSLVVFDAKSVHGQVHQTAKPLVTGRMMENIEKYYHMDAAHFEAEEKRRLISGTDR